MDTEEASWIVSELAQGNTWQFQWTVAQEQANVARSYLSSLGFGLELIYTDAPLAPSESPPHRHPPVRTSSVTGLRVVVARPGALLEPHHWQPGALGIFEPIDDSAGHFPS